MDELQSITFTTVAWKAWPLKKTATPIQFPSFQWHRDGFGCNDPETKGVLHPTISHLLLKLFTGHQWDPCWTLSQVAKPVLCTCSTTKGAASSLNSMPGIAQNCDSFRSGEMVATWFLRVFFFAWSGLCQETSWIHDIGQLELGMRSIYPLVKNITFFSINEHAIYNLYIATCSVTNLKLQSISIHFRKTKTYKRDTFSIVMLCYVRLVSIYKNPRKLQLPGSTMTSAWPPARAWAIANWLQLSTCGMHSQVAHTS